MALLVQQLQADDTELFLEQQPDLLDESHHHDLSPDLPDAPLPERPAMPPLAVDMLPPNEQQPPLLDKSCSQNPDFASVVPQPPQLPPTVAVNMLPSPRTALNDHDVIALLSMGPAAAIGVIPVHQQSWPPCAEDHQPRVFFAPRGVKGNRLNPQGPQSWPKAVEARDQPGLFLFKHSGRRCYHCGDTPHTFKHGMCVGHLSCIVRTEGLAWRGNAEGPASAAATFSQRGSQWVPVKVNGPSGPEVMWRDSIRYVLYSEDEVTPYVAPTREHRSSAHTRARGAAVASARTPSTEDAAADVSPAGESASQPPPPPPPSSNMASQPVPLLAASSAPSDVAARLASDPLPAVQSGWQDSPPLSSHGSTASRAVPLLTSLSAEAGYPLIAAAASLPLRSATGAALPLVASASAASIAPLLRVARDDAHLRWQASNLSISQNRALSLPAEFSAPFTEASAALLLSDQEMHSHQPHRSQLLGRCLLQQPSASPPLTVEEMLSHQPQPSQLLGSCLHHQPSAALSLSDEEIRGVLMSGSLADFRQHFCAQSLDQLLDLQRHDPFERGVIHQLVTFGKQRPEVTAQCLLALKAAVGPAGFGELMAQVNNNGSTPLHTAAAFASDDRLAPFEVLLFETPVEALLTAETKRQWLVHHIAAKHKHRRAVQLCARHILNSPYGEHLKEVAFFDVNSRVFRDAGGPEALRAALAEMDVAVLDTESRAQEAAHMSRLMSTYRRCRARAASDVSAEMERIWSVL